MPGNRKLAICAAILTAGMAATVGSALAFEHIGGYIPCKLCLEQRLPYYIGAPLMAVAAGLAWSGQARLSRGLIAIGGLLMAWGLVLAIYHSGVEWHFWEGPGDCGAVAGSAADSGKSVLDMLNDVVPPSCDEAAGRFLGLSFANANVLTSLVLSAASLLLGWRGTR